MLAVGEVGVMKDRELGTRAQVFWLEMLYLCLLSVVAVWYLAGQSPEWLTDPTLRIPPGVLFFGAVGGVTISLNGVFIHRNDWDPKYAPWHVARPFMGATVAAVAVLIFEAGVLAVGAVQPPPPQEGAAAAVEAPRYLLYYVIAFVVGYRESTFRDLVERAADLLLKSPPEAALPAIGHVEPSSLPIAGGRVKITGSGLTGTQWVRFGAKDATFSITSDGEIEATVPPAAQPGPVSVTLLTKQGAASYGSPFTFT